MYKHILIATDGSELAGRAVTAGPGACQGLNAKVTVVTATEPWTAMVPARPRWCSPRGLREGRRGECRPDPRARRRRPRTPASPARPCTSRTFRGGRHRRDRQGEGLRPDRDGLARPSRPGQAAAGQRGDHGADAQLGAGADLPLRRANWEGTPRCAAACCCPDGVGLVRRAGNARARHRAHALLLLVGELLSARSSRTRSWRKPGRRMPSSPFASSRSTRACPTRCCSGKLYDMIGLPEFWVVPVAVIGHNVVIGYIDDETTGKEILNHVAECRKTGCPDAVHKLIDEPSVDSTRRPRQLPQAGRLRAGPQGVAGPEGRAQVKPRQHELPPVRAASMI